MRKRVVLILFILQMAFLNNVSASHHTVYDLYKLKAAFIYNFIKYIQWPDDTGTRVNLCLFTDDKIFESINEVIKDKLLNGKKLIVLNMKEVGLNQNNECDIVFISKLFENTLELLLSAFNNSPVLTIGESEEFERLGGIIIFFIEDNKIRFKINNSAARQSNLTICSHLLKLSYGN